MRTMHLFAGAGGGLLGDLILGHNPIVAVEWEKYPAETLRQRAEEGWFPNLEVICGDVREFNATKYYGRVDCIHAGFPCQDISVAGGQKGIGEGTRSGLYREVLRVADECFPGWIFLENSPAIVRLGLDTVLYDLAVRGYDAEWMCLSAAECGAPHLRDRWWLLARQSVAHTINKGLRSRIGGDGVKSDEEDRGRDDHETGSRANAAPSETGKSQNMQETVAHSSQLLRDGINDNTGDRQQREAVPQSGNCGGTEDVAHSDLQRCEEPNDAREPSIQKRLAGEADDSWWSKDPGDGPECQLGRVAPRMADNVHRLKAIGNGQVPLTAALAFTILMRRFQ